MASTHTVKSFEHELQRLASLITQMGGLAEAQLEASVEAVVRRDVDGAARVMQADASLDGYEQAVEQETVRMLALRQPMGIDLREIIAALKISTDLERCGDHAANIAKRAIALSQLPPVRPVGAIPRMARIVREMLKDVLDAYVERDTQRAIGAWNRDRDLDDLYNSLFREILTYMMEDPRNITPCTHLLFIAKNLERCGDHATNIAETVHFLVEGAPLGKNRVKGDNSSFEVLEPPAATEPDPTA
jgi:phosphate transport system protein